MGLDLKSFIRTFRFGWLRCALRGGMVLGFVLGAVSWSQPAADAPAVRAQRFLRGRKVAGSGSASAGQAIAAARVTHAGLVSQTNAGGAPGVSARAVGAKVSALNASWQAVGPMEVASSAYGFVSGRVTAIAVNPADTTGNTVYVGTTGGGVWKSANAMGAAGSVSFTPLTDTLPVFSLSGGATAVASLSIGALSMQGGVLLAGTGDPNDATDSYYGSGLLRSVDGGATWTLVQGSRDGVAGNHSWVGLGFAGFAWSGASPGLVVAAVSSAAEAAVVNGADAANSVRGLYYSNDAGVTWQTSVVMDGSQLVQGPGIGGAGGNAATAVVWNPIRRRFYAALRYHGYYESGDGVNWTRLASQPGAGLSGVGCTANPQIADQLSCPIFRGALAVQSVTGDLFALTVDRNNVDQGLWQDVCASTGSACAGAVTFGRRLGGAALDVGGVAGAITQGDYNLTLAAMPVVTGGVVDTSLYVGTVDLYKCSVGAGCALRNTTNAVNGCGAAAKVAPAQHAIGLSGAAIFLGNDGGVWRSLDGVNEQAAVCSSDDATHFENLNGGLGSLAEVVRFAQHPTDMATLLVGLGANGSAGASGGSSEWRQLSAGEGPGVAIDQGNPANWYVSTAAGVSVKACGNGAGCGAADFAGAATIGAAQVSGDAALVDVAWMLDPAVPAEMLVGTCRVWRGPAGSGTAWSSSNAISRGFNGINGVCGATSPQVRALGAGGATSAAVSAQNAGAQVLYAGMAGTLDGGGAGAGSVAGHVFTTVAGGTASPSTSWTDVGLSLVGNDAANAGRFNPGGFDVSSVAVDGHDATGKTVYVTVMGFSGNGESVPHVYRSVDGGGHWTNVSSNLPNAPANSVVVDPNDANTVYVGLDTGVYVTTQVANCATTNCWSVYGVGLPNSPVMELAAAAGMATGDGRTGELRVGTYGRGIWQIPLLTAASPAAPGMSVAPGALVFGVQAVGTSSAAQTMTVTNSGNAPLVVSQVVATGDFHITDTCVGTAVAAGATCTVTVTFLPSSTGARSGVLTVYGNVAGGQAAANLSGTAVAGAAIVLNPVTIIFSATTVGATSVATNITISNTGGVAVGLGSIAASGDFAVAANTCGNSLAAGVGCTVAVVFRPTVAAMRSGVLTVADDLGPQTVALSGTGTSPATDGLSPGSLSFAVQQVNTVSAAQQVTLTNLGDVALTLIGAQVTSGDFTVVNGCGNSLNAHSSCSMSVAFVPKSVGAGAGALTVNDQFRSQTVVLNGTGVAPPGVSLSPVATLTFGSVAVGSVSAAQVVTLTNNGGLPLSLFGVVVAGDFVLGSGGTCSGVVAVGATCVVPVSFTPTAGGTRNGTVTVTDNALNSPQVIALTGNGVDFSLAANGATSATITSGKSAVFPLLLSSAAGVPGSAVLSCAGVPANATCVVSPGTVALGGTTTVLVTVSTGVVPVYRSGAAWLSCLVGLGLLVRRRRLLGLVVLGLLVGCGSGRKIPADGSGTGTGAPVTPAGTYNVVVSATSVGLVRTVALTVVVQ